MIYEGGIYRTAQLSILTPLIFIDIKDFQESGMKKAIRHGWLFILLPSLDSNQGPSD